MIIKFIKFCLVFIVIGSGVILYKQPNLLSSVPGAQAVKGISTSKAVELPNQLKSEAEKQIKNIKISDLPGIFDQTKKFANDLRAFQDYIKKEAENLIKKK